MTNKITSKIVGYRVKNSDTEQPQEQQIIEPSIMHEGINRADTLDGRTYKIKTPKSEHAVYLTINSIELDGIYHPYEVFTNCKCPDNHQWTVALTRLISAVFRKGGDVRFMANELLQVFDPNGGHWTKKGANGEKPRFMPSLIAEIGLCLEKHFDYIDDLNKSEEIKQDIDKRVKDYNDSIDPVLHEKEKATPLHEEDENFPPSATKCAKCHAKAVVVKDGCPTCLNCGDSKCG